MTSFFDPRRLTGRLFYLLVAFLTAFGTARAVPPQTTTINDIVYRADGSAASGTLLITWPQFSTSDNKAVAAGTMNVTIGSGGTISLALAPNEGASPAGTFYKVTYKLDDGTSSTEYWTVPSTSPTTISAIRSTVVPASMAVQVVSRNYVDGALAAKAADNTVVHIAGDTMTGALTLSADPSAAMQAATKNYVDTHATSTPGQVVVDGVTYPTIHAAVVAAGTNGSVLIPAIYSGSDTDPNPNKIQIIDLRGKPNRQRGYINVLTDCGLKGDGVANDGPAIQACLDAYPGYGFVFPQTVTHGCSYKSNQTLFPKGSGYQIIGQSGSNYLDGIAGVGHLGGVEICFAAGVSGFWHDGNNAESGAYRNITVRGGSAISSLLTPTAINLPSDLPQFTRSLSSIQRLTNVLTGTIVASGATEGLTQQVGSTINITGVVGDSTINGRCIIATLSPGGGSATNPRTFTCSQNGPDTAVFTNDGTISVPSMGAGNADGFRICGNFVTLDHVGAVAFERHGINADSRAGHGCAVPFSDHITMHDSIAVENGGNGFYCTGVDCNASFMSGTAFYYNMLWGAEDQSSLGNTWVGNNISNNGHLWAASTTPATKSISSISRNLSGGISTVTIVLSAADTNLKLGSCVVIAGVTDSSFNTTAGQCFFITSFTDSQHFQYEQPGAPANASSSGGTSRMAKFGEVYLSAGVDDGAEKFGTQGAVAQSTIVGNYVEGGQNCKFGATIIVLGLQSCGSGDWIGQYMTTEGCSGLAGSLCMNLGAIYNNADAAKEVFLKAGSSADQNFQLSWVNHSTARTWRLDVNNSGTLGGSGFWHLSSDGLGQSRIVVFGKDNTGGTIISAESTGAVAFNKNFAGTSAGTGGVEFWSGGAAPAKVGSVDAAGLASFVALKSGTANPASAGQVRLAKSDSINFRNNANTADVAALSLNASDQAVLPTVASLASAGNLTAPAFVSSTANPASAGQARLAQADTVKFRNSANTADLTALSEAGDVLQVGEAVNGINVPGPANVSDLTASGTVSAAAISTGGDSFANTPRIAWGSFLPGTLNSIWTAAQFTLKKAINVVQVDLRAKTAPAGCTTFPVVQITDGTTPINVTLNSAGVAQSVAGGQNYAVNATLLVKVSTAGAGCTTNAADVNVTVQYKMQ
jgi:hypothetical protein